MSVSVSIINWLHSGLVKDYRLLGVITEVCDVPIYDFLIHQTEQMLSHTHHTCMVSLLYVSSCAWPGGSASRMPCHITHTCKVSLLCELSLCGVWGHNAERNLSCINYRCADFFLDVIKRGSVNLRKLSNFSHRSDKYKGFLLIAVVVEVHEHTPSCDLHTSPPGGEGILPNCDHSL